LPGPSVEAQLPAGGALKLSKDKISVTIFKNDKEKRGKETSGLIMEYEMYGGRVQYIGWCDMSERMGLA
jgi:hypothetical protein